MTTSSANYLTELHQLLNQYFNLAEIQDLCFRLHIDYESVPGDEKPSRIRALLLGLGRNGRLPELVSIAQQQRPDITWPLTPHDFQSPVSLSYDETKVFGEKEANRAPHFAHPYPLQKHFRGRQQERKQLSTWISNGNEALYTLVAIGGMGKSALAWIWLLHDVLGEKIPSIMPREISSINKDMPLLQGIFWWSFQGSEANFSAFLDEALIYLAGHKQSYTTPYEKVQSLLRYLQAERILLVLDNFEQELQAFSQLDSEEYDFSIEENIPSHFRACITPYAATFLQQAASIPLDSKILITTRLFPMELDELAGCHRENLQPMTQYDAQSFFTAHGITGANETIRTICENYGYHPLTLRLIAGLVINDLVLPGNIKAFTQQKNAPLIRHQQILNLSYDTLPPSQQSLLSRLAAFRSNITYSAIVAINPFDTEQLLQDNLRALIERELLQSNRLNRLYSLHPIIRQYAYDRLIGKEGIHRKLRNYFATIPPPVKTERLQDLSPVIELYHHTVQAGLYDDAWDIYNRKIRSILYYNLNEYEYDLQLLQAVPTDNNGIPPLSLPNWQVWWLLYQTMCYERTGQIKKGIEIVQKALTWSRTANLENSLAQSQIPYASLCCDAGQIERAFQTIQEASKHFDKYGDNNWQGISHRIYGRILLTLGRYEDAWQQFDLTHHAYGKNSRFIHGRSVLQAHKATWYLWQGQYEEAIIAAKSGMELSKQGNYRREFIHASYLFSETLIQQALATSNAETFQNLMLQAKEQLDTALISCQQVFLVELEGRVLLALAKWFFAKQNWKQAYDYAQKVLEQATKHQYRLTAADACTLLAEIAQNQSDNDLVGAYTQQAQTHASYHSSYRYEIVCTQIDAIRTSIS